MKSGGRCITDRETTILLRQEEREKMKTKSKGK